MLTKTAFQPLKIWWLYRPLREQARSRNSDAGRYISILARNGSTLLTPRIPKPQPKIPRTMKYSSEGPNRQPSPVWKVAVSAP